MRVARAVSAVALLGALEAAVSGCPSLDGFVSDGGAPEADADAGPSGGFLSLEDAVRFCSKTIVCPNLAKSTLISLHVPVDDQNFASCVSWLAGTVPTDQVGMTQRRQALACATQAATCSVASACMWFEFVSATDPRCVGYTGGTSGECAANGATTLYCSAAFGAEFVEHCDNAINYSGSTCLLGNQGLYFCAVANVSCAAGCSGTFYTQCDQGLLTGIDCNVLGLTCGKDPQSNVDQCLSNGAYKACGAAGTVACAGDHVTVCDGIYESEYDCDALGGTCDATGVVARCALPGDACTPFDSDVGVCSGDSISLCVGGRPQSFDCTTLGMHCVAASGKISAHCE